MSVHDAEDGRELQSWSGDAWPVRAACFGVRGQHVYAVHDRPPETQPAEAPQGEVVILAVDDGEQVGWLKGHEGGVSEIRCNPDGKHVVTASQDGTARLWDADFQPRDATAFPSIGPAGSAVFSPDGKLIFVAGGSSYDRNTWEGFGALWDPGPGSNSPCSTGAISPK
jgi:WD40 repeat protein